MDDVLIRMLEGDVVEGGARFAGEEFLASRATARELVAAGKAEYVDRSDANDENED